MENDPEGLDLACVPLLHYGEVFHDYRKNSRAAMDAWKNDPLMAEVQQREFEAAAGALGVSLEPDEGEPGPDG